MKPARVAMPPVHRPVEMCPHCGQLWPCTGEKARVEQARAAEEAALPAPSTLADQVESMLRRSLTPASQGQEVGHGR